ncbi:MAG: hypothetical protein AAF228_07675 [Pseudomonadota bacterium]
MTKMFTKIQRMSLAIVLFSGFMAISNIQFSSPAVSAESNIRISKIKVRYAEDADINWWAAEREYMNKYHGSSDVAELKEPGEDLSDAYIRISKGPKAMHWIKKKLTRLVKASLRRDVVSHFSGRKGVVLDIKIKEFFVPDPARRIMLGGFPELHFVTTARYARNGRVIGTYDQKVLALALGGSGVVADQLFPDLEERIMDNYEEDIIAMLVDNA